MYQHKPVVNAIKPGRKFTSDFKAKEAKEAIKDLLTIEQICKKYELHPTQANLWKKELLANAPILFDKKNLASLEKNNDKKIQKLYVMISQLKNENNFLKKN